ncbi:MAG: hypothetical protein HY727_19965 [Candidatus Rokubacteria bacterium]|nr:hypothetical protein [Candidatus Rokubacteria bacterium]
MGDMDEREELVRRLVEALAGPRRRTAAGRARSGEAVRVEDDETLLVKAQLDETRRRATQAKQQLDVVLAEANALKERLFLRLHELHPAIMHAGNGTAHVESREDAVWYIAGARDDEEDE